MRKPPIVEDGQPFRFEPYAWVFSAIHGTASHFPIVRWVKPLKQVEVAVGKLAALRGWAYYLNNTEARYVSAASFARAAGQWTREAPDCDKAVFATQDSVTAFFVDDTPRPPAYIVQRGAEAVRKWLDEQREG